MSNPEPPPADVEAWELSYEEWRDVRTAYASRHNEHAVCLATALSFLLNLRNDWERWRAQPEPVRQARMTAFEVELRRDRGAESLRALELLAADNAKLRARVAELEEETADLRCELYEAREA